MALAARGRGTSFQLLGKAETTIGTAATGNFAKLPVVSFDLAPSRPLVADPVISQGYGRNPPPTYYDKLEVRGSVVVPLDTGNIDFWGALMFGAVVTTGTAPVTDTYTAGGTPTAATFEKGFTDVSDYWLFTGVHADGFTLNFAPTGTAQMNISLVGMGSSAMSGSSSGGTPTTATYAPVRNIGATVLIGGAAAGNIVSGNLAFKQNLDPIYTMEGATTGAPTAVDPGLLDLRGSLVARYDGNTLDGYARAGTVQTLSVSYPLTGGFALNIDCGQVKFETAQPGVSGPGGIEQTINFVGEYDGNPTYTLRMTRTR